ncbi:MAG TPA: hypothetical protein VFG83_16160, partial [Kofleriaceae bacterium]|nr:hypothetical protein [Kofleriaceae bacterium]
RDALTARANTLKAQVDSELSIYEATIASHADQGEVTVAAEAAAADAEVQADSLQAAGNLAAAHAETVAAIATDNTAMAAASTATFAQAQTQVDTVESTESAAFVQLLLTLAADIDSLTADGKSRADAAGAAAAQENDPTAHDGSPMGALSEGRASLRADVRRKIATDTATEAGNAVERSTKPVADQLRAEADQIAGRAVVPYTEALRTDIPPTSDAAADQLAGASDAAAGQAQTGHSTATQAVTASQIRAQTQIAAHRERSRVRFTGKSGEMVDHLRALGEELKSNLDATATDLGNHYAERVTEVQGDVEAAETPEEAAAMVPGIEETLASLDTMSEEDLAALDEVYETGIAGFEEYVAGQEGSLAAAVAADVSAIRAARTHARTQIGATGQQLSGRIHGIAEAFRENARQGVADSQQQTAAFSSAAQAGAAQRRAELVATVEQTKKQATDQLTAALANIPQAIEQQAGPAYDEKEGGLQQKAQRLFDAFDGAGTDEGDIHVVLAEASYGEIEAIEATYNHAYSERAEDGMTPLRYDLSDEMGGDELGAALAFLRHDRQTGIRLALDSATGFWNDEEGNIRSLLATCSDEEIESLNTSPEGQAVVAELRSDLGGCDLDVVNTYLDTSIAREDRLTRVTAIKLYEASVDQMGTEEADVEQILEDAKTPEERRRLRAAFNQYSDEKVAEQAEALRAQGYSLAADNLEATTGGDHLAAMIESEFSGDEQTVVEQLAATERNETAIDAARLLEGAEGAGTNEDRMIDALDDEDYAGRHSALEARLHDEATSDAEKAQIRQQLAAMEHEREAALNAQLSTLSEGEEDSVEILLYQEFFDCSPEMARLYAPAATTYEDVLAGNRPRFLSDPMLGYMVALRKLKRGAAEPELELKYAVVGDGTNEALIKKALSNNGQPMSKAEVATLLGKYHDAWGETLASHNEMALQAHMVWELPDQYQDYDDFTAPSGVLDGELDGRDWLDVRVLLCGKPTTPEERNYITMLKTTFETDGVGDGFIGALDAVGFTDKASHLEAVRGRYRDSRDQMDNLGLGGENLEDLEQGRVGNEARNASLTDDERAEIQEATGEFMFEGEAVELAAESYGKFKESVISGVITALEIAAAVAVSVLTAGAGSGLLVVILANAAVGVGGIVLKRAALGAAYGVDQMAIDAAIAIGAAAVSEIKVFSKFGKAAAEAGAAASALERGVLEGGGELIEGGTRVLARDAESLAARAASHELGAGALQVGRRAETEIASRGLARGERALVTETAGVAERETAQAVEGRAVREGVTEAGEREVVEAGESRAAREGVTEAGEREVVEVGESRAAREGVEAGEREAVETAETRTAREGAEAGERETVEAAETRTAREGAEEGAESAAAAGARQAGQQGARAAQKKTIRELALEQLDDAFWSEIWNTVTSEQTWQGKPLDVLTEWAKTVALNVIKGIITSRVGDLASLGGATSRTGRVLEGAGSSALGHISGTFIDATLAEMINPGTDAGHMFWDQLLKGMPKALADGAAGSVKEQLVARATARHLARQFTRGQKSAADLERMRAAGELTDEQVRIIHGYVSEHAYELDHIGDDHEIHEAISLPQSFQDLAASSPAPASAAAPAAADPATVDPTAAAHAAAAHEDPAAAGREEPPAHATAADETEAAPEHAAHEAEAAPEQAAA